MVAWKKNQQYGFTLVELLVTITIFTILTGVVLFSQSKFNSSILLTNLAYDTALTIRQAQNYGINIKEYDGGLFLPYGVHFDMSSDKSFILFADHSYAEGDTTVSPYDSSNLSKCDSGHGCVNRYNIKGGNSISNLCVYVTGDPSTDDICRPVQTLDIIFQRPNPDAKIFADIDGEEPYDISNADSAEITVIGSDGSQQRRVRVQSNGLIEILNN